MKEAQTIPGKTYSVHTPNGCLVSDDSGWIKEIVAPDGYFTAHGSSVQLSDDEATLREVFKRAPQQKLALLGVLGGNDGLPDGFKRVAYLGSTGTQSIIGAAAQPLNGQYVELRAQAALPGNPAVTETAISSTVFSLSDFLIWIPYNYENNTRHVRWDFPGVNAGQYYTAYAGVYEFSTYKKQGGDCYINGELVLSTISTFAENNKFGLFHRLSGVTYNRGGQVAWVKVGEPRNEKLHLIPALDPIGAPCMFDLVTRTPFYNSGTGDFLYPGKEEEPTTYSLRRPITYAQLTPHGIRRLYHVPKGYNGTKEEYAMEHGFKQLVETERPEEGYWAPQWRETEEEIVLEWVETEPPEESFSQGLQNDETLTNQ